MCLTKVMQKVPNPEGIGYKVVELRGYDIESAVYLYKLSRTKWMTARIVNISAIENYKSGFHIFKYKSAAINLMNALNMSFKTCKHKVYTVTYRKVHTQGYDNWKSEVKRHTIVAQQMKLIKEVN